MKFPPSLFLTSLWLHAFTWSRNVAIRYGTENYSKRKAESSTSSLLGRKEVQCLHSQEVHRSIWGAGCCPLLWKIREPCSNPSNARKKWVPWNTGWSKQALTLVCAWEHLPLLCCSFTVACIQLSFNLGILEMVFTCVAVISCQQFWCGLRITVLTSVLQPLENVKPRTVIRVYVSGFFIPILFCLNMDE